ncbi:MAG TPA: hypothetical protein EYP19_11845, partial [Desulfobacterales bacterium]|nr:hypothetical protein [Desulfobacterales bacterium]
MSYDLYVELRGSTQGDVDAIVNGKHRNIAIPSIATRIRLLASIAAHNGVKEYAVSGDRRQGGGYKSLVHIDDP